MFFKEQCGVKKLQSSLDKRMINRLRGETKKIIII